MLATHGDAHPPVHPPANVHTPNTFQYEVYEMMDQLVERDLDLPCLLHIANYMRSRLPALLDYREQQDKLLNKLHKLVHVMDLHPRKHDPNPWVGESLCLSEMNGFVRWTAKFYLELEDLTTGEAYATDEETGITECLQL